jgi:hypothetical protein
MVINSTNINKTNNHLLSSLISFKTQKITIYDVGNTGLDLEQAQKCSGLKMVNRRLYIEMP